MQKSLQQETTPRAGKGRTGYMDIWPMTDGAVGSAGRRFDWPPLVWRGGVDSGRGYSRNKCVNSVIGIEHHFKIKADLINRVNGTSFLPSNIVMLRECDIYHR